MKPTPIAETSTGKKITARRYPRPISAEVSRTARPMPNTIFAKQVMNA